MNNYKDNSLISFLFLKLKQARKWVTTSQVEDWASEFGCNGETGRKRADELNRDGNRIMKKTEMVMIRKNGKAMQRKVAFYRYA